MKDVSGRSPAARTVRTWRGRAPRRRHREQRRLDLRLLAPVAVAWVVAAFAGLLVDLAVVWVGSVSALALAALLIVPSGPWSAAGASRRLVALTLAVTSLLLLTCAAQRTIRAAGPIDDLARSQAVVTLSGTLTADPRPVTASTSRGGPLVAVRIEVDTVVGRGVRTEVQTPVLVLGPDSTWGALGWNDGVELAARLAPSEPGDDVVAVARPLGAPRVIGGPGPVLEAAELVRERNRAATDHVWADARGLVPALVLGDRSRTPPDLSDAMRATGLSHLSAVSGTNVTLVVAVAVWACGLLGVRRRWRPLVAVVVLAAFVTIARPEPSVVRAAVMGTVGLLAFSTSRRRAGVPVLGGAVVALLVWDPWLARSYGFALSAVATLGLLVLARPWGAAIASGLPTRLAPLGPVLAVPLAAQAVCAPLVVPLQGSVSVIAVVANVLAAPFVAPTTIAGVAVAGVAVVWPGAAAVLAWTAALPAQAIAWVARRCADAPIVADRVGRHGVARRGARPAHRRSSSPCSRGRGTGAGPAPPWPGRCCSWPPDCLPQPGRSPGRRRAGSSSPATSARATGSSSTAARAGPSSSTPGPSPTSSTGASHGWASTSVDLVVLTHFHADHVDGLAGVLAHRPVTEIRSSPVRDPPGEAEAVARLAAATRTRVGELRAGQRLEVGAVAADVWWPAREIDAGSVANNGSVVLTLHVGGVEFPARRGHRARGRVCRPRGGTARPHALGRRRRAQGRPPRVGQPRRPPPRPRVWSGRPHQRR